MIDQGPHLAAALRCVNGFGASLHRIADTICLSAPATMPQGMQWELAAICGRRVQTFRHDGKTAPHAGETCVLRKAAELDCAFVRAWNFVDRMRDLRVADVGLIG